MFVMSLRLSRSLNSSPGPEAAFEASIALMADGEEEEGEKKTKLLCLTVLYVMS